MKRFLQFKYTGAVLLALWVHFAVAQNVRVDQTFNPDDIGSQIGVGFNADVIDAAYLPDGKIIVVGGFTSYNGVNCQRIARLNADGTLDASFDVATGFEGNMPRTVHILPSGKVLITGWFSSYKGTAVNGVVRLNEDGTLDNSFTSGLPAGSFVLAALVTANGKIIIGGNFETYSGTSRNGIVMLNSDGTLDMSFDPGSGLNPRNVTAIEVQPDGKILIGGSFTQYNGATQNRLARLNTNGTLDASFATGTGLNGSPQTVKCLADGKILVGGSFTTYNAASVSRAVRLNSDGARDASFAPVFDNSIQKIYVQNDGRYLFTGSFSLVNGVERSRIARMEPDGTLLGTMAPTRVFNANVGVAPNEDESKFIVFGTSLRSYNGRYVGGLVQIDADGVIDDSFFATISLTGFNSQVNAVAVQSDGKVLVGGFFTGYNGKYAGKLIRLLADGTPDATFETGSGFNGDAVNKILIDANEKIVVTGNFSNYNGVGRSGIARLNSDGSLDASFIPDGGVPTAGSVSNLALQGDGKILLVGTFTSYSGVARNRIARVNTNGSLDASFNPAGPGTGALTSVAVQSDGKILVGGTFLTFNGVERKKIARMNADGSLDLTFDQTLVSDVNPSVNAIGIQSSGKIIVGYSGATSLFRLNADGSRDDSYAFGFVNVLDLKIQPDDKIMVIGTSGVGIAKFTADGAVENFNLGGNVGNMRCFAVNNIGDVYIGGNFTTLPGAVTRNRFARLNVLKAVTISGLTVNEKVYDGTRNFTLSGTPVLNGVEPADIEDVVLDGSNVEATSLDKSMGFGKAITVTGYQLTGAAAHRYGLLQPTGLVGRVKPKELIITGLTGAENKVYDGLTGATILGTPVIDGGVVPGDNVVVTGVIANFDSRHVGEGKTVTVSGLIKLGSDQNNYVPQSGLTFTADITPAPVQIQVTAQDKVYDGSATATLEAITIIGLSGVDPDVRVDADAVVATFADKNVGTGKEVTATNLVLTGEGKDNFHIENATAATTASITKRLITVIADDKSRKYAEQNPVLTVSYEGLVDGDDAADIDTPPVAGTDAPSTANAGLTYPITVSGGSDNNYEFEFAEGVLSITKAAATINMADATMTYDGTAKSINISTEPADLSVALTYKRDGNQVTSAVNAGAYTVDAIVEDTNYEASKTATLTIGKAEAAIAFNSLTATYDGNVKAASFATTPSGLLASASYKQNGVLMNPTNAGNYDVEVTIADQNYQGTTSGVFTINKAAQTITFTPVSDRFTTADPFAVTASASSGLPVAISVASGPAAYSNGLVSLTGATGTVTLSFAQAGNMNYEAATAVSDVFEVLEDPIMSAEQPLERSIQVYPVPAKSRLTIAVSNADYSLSHVNLYDLSGTVLKRERLEGVKSFEISVDEYPAGVLLMEVMTSNHEKMIKRIVIIK